MKGTAIMDDRLNCSQPEAWPVGGVIWKGIQFEMPVIRAKAPVIPAKAPVIPAKAGIQSVDSLYPKTCGVDSRFRGNDRDFERPCLANDTSTLGLYATPLRHHGKDDRRGMLSVVGNRIGRLHPVSPTARVFARVQIAVKAWKIATRDFQAQHVPLQENVRRGPQIEAEFVGLTRIHELDSFRGFAVTGPQDSLREILRKAIRPNVHHLRGEVRIHG